MGIRAGWVLDFAPNNETRGPWDFRLASKRDEAARELLEDKPALLAGSLACTDWSTLINFGWNRMDPEDVQRRKAEARTHIEFCVKLRKMHHDAGRYVSHKHPQERVHVQKVL